MGTITARAGTVAGFNTMKSEILGDAEMATAMGGDPVRTAQVSGIRPPSSDRQGACG